MPETLAPQGVKAERYAGFAGCQPSSQFMETLSQKSKMGRVREREQAAAVHRHIHHMCTQTNRRDKTCLLAKEWRRG